MYLQDISYDIHEKILKTPDISDYDKTQGKQLINNYDPQKTITVLKVLGFDISYNRKQAVEVIDISESTKQKYSIYPTWYSYTADEIEKGRATFIRGNGKEIITRFIGLHYQSEKIRNILAQHEYGSYNCRKSNKYPDLSDDLRLKINRYNKKGVGLNQSKYSKVIYFDIDNHDYDNNGKTNADNTLQILYKHLGYPKEIFIERSFSGGYHVAFAVNDIVNDQDSLEFVKNFQDKYDCHLEVRTSEKIFRIPNHFTYTPGYTIFKDKKISFIPFKDKEYYKDHILNIINNTDIVLDYKKISEFNKKKKKIVKPRSCNVFSRIRKSNPTVLPYPLAAGCRNENTLKNALIAITQGMLFEEYFNKLDMCYTSSRDWGRWSYDRKRKEASRAYESAMGYISGKSEKYKPKSFLSNIDYIPDNIKTILNNPLIISKFCIYRESNYLSIRDRNYRETSIMIQEVIGKILYDLHNPVNIDDKLTGKELSEHLSIGSSISYTFLEKLKNHYNMQGDIFKMFNHFVKYSGIIDQYIHDERGYRFATKNGDISYSRQFIVKDTLKDKRILIDDVIDSLIKSLRSMVRLLDTTILKIKIYYNHGKNEYSMSEVLFPNLRSISHIIRSIPPPT